MSPISSGTSRSRVSTTSLRFSEFVLGTSLISQTDSQANISGNEPTFDESTNTNLSFIPDEIPDDHGITDLTTPRRSGRCPQDTVTSTPSHNIFYGAKELGDAIQSHIFKLPWPPNSQNLTLSTAEDAVPPLLYNFLASACGLTDQATLPDALELNKLSPADHSKLLSICQDIVNLQSHGKVTTPKSLSLGISVKHRTGSSDLIRLLHSLGHCVSYDTVARAETAIAMGKLQNPVAIPPGFSKGKLLIMVYDNIDFMEQTLSGAGTTHQMNGIMFQLNATDATPTPEMTHSTPISRREKTISSQQLVLEHYVAGKRVGIPVSNTPTELHYSKQKEQDYMLQEFKYIIAKTESTHIPPAWIGYQKQATPKYHILGRSSLHYLKNIEAPPNDMATVSNVLQQCVEKADIFELDAWSSSIRLFMQRHNK